MWFQYTVQHKTTYHRSKYLKIIYIYVYKVMSDKIEKDRVIRQVYYDVDTGFSSISDTYKDSKKY